MEMSEGQAASAQGLLASNPYGITANDISIHGASAQELCGREARTIGGRSAALVEVAKIMDIDVTPELVIATLHRSCPQTRGKPLPDFLSTKAPALPRAKPALVWPVAAGTSGAAVTAHALN
jgi:hypothetical protein